MEDSIEIISARARADAVARAISSPYYDSASSLRRETHLAELCWVYSKVKYCAIHHIPATLPRDDGGNQSGPNWIPAT